MKTNLFLVSLLACVVSTNAFARGHRSGTIDESIVVLRDIEVLGPYAVDVDYSLPLAYLVEKVPYNQKPMIDAAALEVAKKKLAPARKIRRDIYLIRAKTVSLGIYTPEVRNGLKDGSLAAANDKVFLAALEKKLPGLKPAGAYELFTFAAVRGNPTPDKNTSFSVWGEPNIRGTNDLNGTWTWFQTSFYDDGRIYVTAALNRKDNIYDRNDFTLFMR